MKMRGMVTRVFALCLLLAVLAVPQQAAAQGVPTAVLDAKSGVVRIITEGEYGTFTGSGFIVGTGERLYVVTNHHVVEDTDTFYIFYDSGRYVTASIYHDDPSRDLCVLKPDNTIPRAQILPIETGEIESGIGVYALGYPAAADYFTQNMEEAYNTEQEFLAAVTADKKSMTITDGIVSAIHSSTLIGDGTRAVETLQTNTVLNGGNSGGPLLNEAGRVVGVNTMGLADADGINGAVHANEIVKVLKEARIRFNETPQEVASTPAEAEASGVSPVVVIMIVVGLAVVGGGVAVAMVLARQKKTPVKGGITLEEFERTYRKVEELATLEMGLRFVNDLLPLAKYDLNPLFTPTNVVIGDNAIGLMEKSARPQPGTRPVFGGYSAPEVLNGRADPASTVYFIGGILYTMITGHRPPEAQQRLAANQPVFQSTQPVPALINRAMEPYQQNRIQDLYQLSAAMQQVADSLRSRNGY